jgi:hypothetical protein
MCAAILLPSSSLSNIFSAETALFKRSGHFIIKVPIDPRVKHKMNLTFYVIKTKGLEFSPDTEAGGGFPGKNKKARHKVGLFTWGHL